MTFTPTPEQAAIVAAATSSEDNLLVAALAGAAKTSTLILVAEALPKTATLCLAFNKRIAKEMEARLPGHCVSATLNSVGHRAWGQAIGRRLIIDPRKNFAILKSLVDELSGDDKEAAYEDFSETLHAIAWAKTCGYVPDGKYPQAKRLMGDEDFFADLEVRPTELQEDLIRKAVLESIKQSFAGTLDFDDQIFMSTLFPVSFPQFPLVMIDEAQDLSELNHAMLRKLARKRLIAVGDACQSIYAFRGAHESSMDLLRSAFSMRELTLSVSFRCPQAVVREAQWRAPHMRWPDWAAEGRVETWTEWDAGRLAPGTTILCRNNAPLFSMAIRLLKNGRYPELVGNDIGKNLLKWMRKFGPASLPHRGVLQAIDAWQAERERKAKDKGKVRDQAECMRIVARQGKDLGEALAYMDYLLGVVGPVKLMTIHKSKGLEFPTVILLDRHLIRDEHSQQEKNLLYVAQTRAKEALIYASSDGFMGEGDMATGQDPAAIPAPVDEEPKYG